ncbi:MAG: SDR family NAD(P)-dependent oxidoreductase [Candidatus Cryptobacteroides sp.]
MKIENSNVLITGGASGIGRLMGKLALEKGAACLVIWDINPTSIASVTAEFSKIGKVKGYVADVSRNEAVIEAYEKTVAECGNIDILINCAGIVTSNKTFDKQTADEIIRTININTIAPMLVTRVFLPGMLKRNRGHICNITSAGGMLGNPKMSVYGASKWGATGWSESMRIELTDSNVNVTTVAPYYINTGMFDGVRSKVFPILKPEYVAGKVIKAIEKNTIFAGIPFGFHFIRFWQGILPTKMFDVIFGEWFGIYHTMDNFTGRTRQQQSQDSTKKVS